MNDEFNIYINKMLNDIVKGKRIKLDDNKLNLLLKRQSNLDEINDLENIIFGKMIVDYRNNYWSFYLKKEKITITNFYFYYFEYNDRIEHYLSQKCKVDILKIQSMQRIITGILCGYECQVIDEMMKKYVLRRYFNRYLVRLKMHFDKRNVLYDENIFRREFIKQTADTIENREAIREVEYGSVYGKDKVKWGLKLKNNELFISEFAQLYLSKDIYDILSRDDEVKITYDCFLEICGLIYVILSGYDYIELL